VTPLEKFIEVLFAAISTAGAPNAIVSDVRFRQRSSMIEVPKQDQKVTWRASLFYHPEVEGIKQTFSRVKAHIRRSNHQSRVGAFFMWIVWNVFNKLSSRNTQGTGYPV